MSGNKRLPYEFISDKPARKQVDAPVVTEAKHEPGTYNIWHHRRIGAARFTDKKQKHRALQRCQPLLDAGKTKGDAQGVSYCCLYFARGYCHRGPDCTFLHRVPTIRDAQRHESDNSSDIFGRERNPGSRDGRKGVGSYERTTTSLYVHLGSAAALGTIKLRELLLANFEVWGPLLDLHVVTDKGIAFVRYEWRAHSEFAKEAMQWQGLEGSTANEILDCRWANDDPNPRAVVRLVREREEAMAGAYLRAVSELAPDLKRARLMELRLAANYREGRTTCEYPDTSEQYGGQAGALSWQQWQQAGQATSLAQDYALEGGEPPDAAARDQEAGAWGGDTQYAQYGYGYGEHYDTAQWEQYADWYAAHGGASGGQPGWASGGHGAQSHQPEGDEGGGASLASETANDALNLLQQYGDDESEEEECKEEEVIHQGLALPGKDEDTGPGKLDVNMPQ